MTTTDQPPESALIEQARTNIRPQMSVRQAASMAGISEARWRQVAKDKVRVRKPATLARMAWVVGIRPDQMRQAGRDDVAAEMEHLLQMAAESTNSPKIEEAVQALNEWLNAGPERGRPPILLLRMYSVPELADAISRQAAEMEGVIDALHAANVALTDQTDFEESDDGDRSAAPNTDAGATPARSDYRKAARKRSQEPGDQ